jgi:4-hydroxybenzoate polyprenyltransferase
MRTLGRLLRLSLAPSAAADIAAGIVIGAGFWPGGIGPFLLIAASLCVYHGGMVLNDWADRALDAEARPERPIPSGSVPASSAALLGFSLLLAGPWLALGSARPSAYALGAVAALACAYDLFGRGPWLGPLLLGLCRAGNLAAGVVYGRLAFLAQGRGPDSAPPAFALEPADLVVPLVYGLYVAWVSCLGRLEDGESRTALGRRPALWLAAAAGTLLALPLAPLPAVAALETPAGALAAFLARQRIPLATVVAAAGAAGLLPAAFLTPRFDRQKVLVAMGMALRRLLVFTAAASLARGTPAGFLVSTAILLGYPLSYGLRRAFPPS